MNPFGVKLYTVHIKPGEAAAHERPVFVKEGFNIFAFIMAFFWALYYRLWWQSVMILAVNALLLYLTKNQILSELGVSVLQLGFLVLVASHANDWRRAKLARQGYIMADIVAGDSMLRAEQRYFERYLSLTAA